MSNPCPRPVQRPASARSLDSASRHARRALAMHVCRCLSAAVLLGALGACADAGYSSGQASQFGGSAPDLNCQFGQPCANARGIR